MVSIFSVLFVYYDAIFICLACIICFFELVHSWIDYNSDIVSKKVETI